MREMQLTRRDVRRGLAGMLGCGLLGWLVLLAGTRLGAGEAAAAEKPNILWIVAEDASPHIGCYGETTIETPHLDRMARQGVRFENAFVTSPVCSPSRSAMVSGMFPTTLGAHHHRSQNKSRKAGGNTAYYDSYLLPKGIGLVPQLFQRGSYATINGGTGKTDYNFIARGDVYTDKEWSAAKQPFFAQVQLRGGKNRGAKVQPPTDPGEVTLPPYYPDHPVLRQDWARYLNSWVQTDNEVGRILQRLEEQRLAKNTIVFFWTDHGVSHLRGKQFLYEEGMRVPLIVRFPGGERAGTVRKDLVEHIDVAATSLELAGLPVPDYLQGRGLFGRNAEGPNEIYAARDRCDETSDMIRAVRTERFKYIRNFRPDLSHMQPNQYKLGKSITQTMQNLHRERELDELQARIFRPRRPVEELYDLENDPHETVNLAGQPEHQETLEALRGKLRRWMAETKDLGVVPEPILEELGKRYGNKYHVLRQPENEGLTEEVLGTIDAWTAKDVALLSEALESEQAAVRWWAATGLGDCADAGAVEVLQKRLDDASAGVRVAAALALAKMGETEAGVPRLVEEIENENLIVGLYAIRAIEQLAPDVKPPREAVEKAKGSPYEFTRRIGRRLGQRYR